MLKTIEPIELITSINDASGIVDLLRGAANTSNAQFEQKYIKPIMVIANYLQELPANRDHHAEVGGAVRFAIHCGYAAQRISEQYLFTPPDKSEFRVHLEPQYRYASYLAAIFSTIAYPLSLMHVVNIDGEFWSKNEPLPEFTLGGGYEVKWITGAKIDHRKGAFYASRLMPIELFCDLDQNVQNEMMCGLTPDINQTGIATSLQKTVRSSLLKVIELDKKLLAQEYVPSEMKPIQAEEIVLESPTPTQTQDENVDVSKVDESVKDVPNTPSQNSDNDDVLKIFSRPMSEMLKVLKQDLIKDNRATDKIKRTNLGLQIPSSYFSNYGFPLARIDSELRSKSMVVNKTGHLYILHHKLGDWLISELKNISNDLFEDKATA